MQQVELNKPLNHIAFIMDGNGRWAKKRHLPRYLGHKEACNRIVEVFDYCLEYHIKVVSFYAFSTENWKRPKAEIDHLFDYLELFFKREIKHLIKDGARVLISGDISKLPLKTQATCLKAMDMTKDCKEIVMNICLNYGGRSEIVRASKMIAEAYKNNHISLDDIDENTFSNYLYTAGLPDVDLMVRTSGEVRTSNFLPYQIAYAELVFIDTYWPDFKKEAFLECLKEYDRRTRRFGGLNNDAS